MKHGVIALVEPELPFYITCHDNKTIMKNLLNALLITLTKYTS